MAVVPRIHATDKPGCGGDSFALRLAVVFESLLTLSRTRELALDLLRRSPSSMVAPALDGRPGDIYDEDAFQHFLGVERTRAKRMERTFLLLLVSVRNTARTKGQVPHAIAPALLAALGVCIREVDFVGWYREGRVAAAVLTQGLEGPDSAARSRVITRVRQVLADRLPSTIADHLRIRVVTLGPKANL